MIFAEHSREVARRFIRTAVVVDDRAFRDGDRGEEPPRGGLTRPSGTRPDETRNDAEPAPPGTAEEHPSTEAQPQAGFDSAHALDAQQVIRDFAAGRVFCTVIGVEKGETFDDLAERVLPLAHQADVFITDWVLFEGGAREGGGASDLILRAVENAETPERFRLILVYTGTPDLRDVARTIEQKLTTAGHPAKIDGTGFSVTCGAVRIAVYAKPEAKIDETVPDLAERVIRYDVLVERVVEEYASATAGLVSNATLAALTAVRDNTHRLLRAFRPELDAPFLAHRAMLPNPDDAGEHLVQLITDEIRSAIEDAGVEQEASLTRVTEWLHGREPQINLGYLFEEDQTPDGTNARAIAEALLRLGTGRAHDAPDLEQLGNKKRRDKIKDAPQKLSLARAFVIGGATVEAARKLDHEFAALTSLRRRYGTVTRMLTAGVIVRRRPVGSELNESGSLRYYLCIQPLCDSVRLSESTQFPFLPLTEIEQKSFTDQKAFALTVPLQDEYVYLKVSYSPRDLCLEAFKPTGDRVLLTAADGKWNVQATNGSAYEYVAELKSEQTNRVLVRFAQQAARPGLDESEWLRRWTR